MKTELLKHFAGTTPEALKELDALIFDAHAVKDAQDFNKMVAPYDLKYYRIGQDLDHIEIVEVATRKPIILITPSELDWV